MAVASRDEVAADFGVFESTVNTDAALFGVPCEALRYFGRHLDVGVGTLLEDLRDEALGA